MARVVDQCYEKQQDAIKNLKTRQELHSNQLDHLIDNWIAVQKEEEDDKESLKRLVNDLIKAAEIARINHRNHLLPRSKKTKAFLRILLPTLLRGHLPKPPLNSK